MSHRTVLSEKSTISEETYQICQCRESVQRTSYGRSPPQDRQNRFRSRCSSRSSRRTSCRTRAYRFQQLKLIIYRIWLSHYDYCNQIILIFEEEKKSFIFIHAWFRGKIEVKGTPQGKILPLMSISMQTEPSQQCSLLVHFFS